MTINKNTSIQYLKKFKNAAIKSKIQISLNTQHNRIIIIKKQNVIGQNATQHDLIRLN